jgi:hypothetical protein
LGALVALVCGITRVVHETTKDHHFIRDYI